MQQLEATFALRLNGVSFDGWTGISVTRSLERMSGEFTVEMGRQKKDGDIFLTDTACAPGASATVEIDGNVVLDGYADNVQFAYDGYSFRVTAQGRDKTGDLIDCAATVNGPFEFRNIKLDAAIRKVLKPFGIPLTVATDIGASFNRLAIEPGESAFDFIERACRFRGVMPVSDGIGGLVLVKPSGEKSPGTLAYGFNILRGDVALDERELYSLYCVKGQAEAVSDETTASEIASPEAKVTDSNIKRYRPKVIVGENQAYDMTLKERAAWESKMSKARSKRATYLVAGWYADAANRILWKPNTLVSVIDPASGINREMLIIAVNYTRDNNGTKASLEVGIPDIFDIPAMKDTSGDGASTLWAGDHD